MRGRAHDPEREDSVMLCILYVNAVGFLLALAALQAERVLPARFSRRWLWCMVIAVSVVLPGYYRNHHAAAVDGMLDAGAAASGTGWGQRIDSLDPMINRVWLAASGVLLLWAVASMCRVWFLVHSARATGIARGAPRVVDGVPVVVTNALGPATVGLLRSHVLLPRWVLALPGAQRRYVVRHEEEHRRAHDGQLLFVASLLLVLVPWNLALWWQLRRLALAVEMDCDNRVVRALGDAPAYGELLLKVAQAGSRCPDLQPALLGGAGSLEQRLIRMLAPAPLRLAQRCLLPVAVAALLLIVLSMPHPVLERTHAHATLQP
jgi:beta-lactamase regulating signal transducer with metallopeptidase domain